ncbi:MAG TPA: hypothetical protein DIW47_10225 [Bacteroidetes bacterium]|nr:hypothetical protein [Bacteroidota bacterium]
MKRKLAILFLILLNPAYVYVSCVWVWLRFKLFMMPSGEERGLIEAAEKTKDILQWLIPLSIGLFLINFLVCRKLIASKRPMFISLVVTLSGVLIIAGFMLYHRQSYLDYQRKNTQLFHYFNERVEVRAEIVRGSKIIEAVPLNEFMEDIGTAKYKAGVWKFAKSFKIMFYLEDGGKDSIMTNGQIFGPYRDKYFATEENVLEKYLGE